MAYEYLAEKRLQALDPQLHGQYRSCVVVANQMLSQYQSTFPEYTDHSTLHTVEIIDCCNMLIGEQIDRLTADDLYVLLMGALFHDVGMGISEKDFYSYYRENVSDTQAAFSKEELQALIRKTHHELSGWFLEKHWQIFDIPSEAYTRAIMQVCRGHRKVDLFDEKAFPKAFAVADGRTVALPYLAALIRLADELDVACSRNSAFLYEPMLIKNEESRMEFFKHQCVQFSEIRPDVIFVKAATDDTEVCKGVTAKLLNAAEVLRYCSDVVEKRTSFTIRQKNILLELNSDTMLL